MTVPVPTLSTDGWLQTTASRCDALFADFVAAAHSQYPLDKIDASLPWLIARHQDDPRGLEEAVTRTLTSYYENYFPAVTTTCSLRDNPADATRYDLYINLTVTDETGSSFTLGKIASVGENRVISIAKENNGTLPTTA